MNDILSEHVRDLAGQAGDVAQQTWSQAGEVAEEAVDAGRRATLSVARQVHESPLITLLIGVGVAFIAGLWLRGGGVPAKAPSPRRPRMATAPKK